MEISDLMTLLLLVLIVGAFWAVIPGLITGWMLREVGKSFFVGFVFGAVCGPAGVLASLVFVSLNRRRTRAQHPRVVRSYYEVPLAGRLHASTVWALAGVATFACVWVLGGLAYELHRSRIFRTREMAASTNTNASPPRASSGDAIIASTPQTVSAATNITDKTPQTGRPPTLDGLATQALRPTQMPSGTGIQLSTPYQPSPDMAAPRPRDAGQYSSSALSPSPPSRHEAVEAIQSPRSTAQGREAVVSELTQSLSARGYRVHASISGDAQTSTLSLSCATLTREVGRQLLGDSRTRAAMRASGIRIVVMINGQESWTYML